MRLHSPINWLGSKERIAGKLLGYIPPHRYYLEAYGGAAALLFAKPPSEFEVYNDIDGELVNFFRVLRDKEKFQRFYEKVCLTPYSREEYNYCRGVLYETEDPVERAYRFYVVARQSFGGDFAHSWGFNVKTIRRGMPCVVSKWLSGIEMLPEIHKRVMTVLIENLPALECMEKYGSAWEYNESFIVVDPPYLPSTRKSGKYRFDMSEQEHVELIDYLIRNQKRNRFMVLGFDNDLYERLVENGWQKICWERICLAIARARSKKLQGKGALQDEKYRRKECIWINYELPSGIDL